MGTFERVLAEVGQALLPLREALESPAAFADLLAELGWFVDDIPAPLGGLRTSVDTLHDGLRAMLGDGGLNLGGQPGDPSAAPASVGPDEVARVLAAVGEVISAVRAVADAPDEAIPAALRADGFAEEFPRQLLDFLVITYLQRHHPRLGFGLRALGVIATTHEAAVGSRPAYARHRLDLAGLSPVLADPSVVLRNAFRWGDDDFDYPALASLLDDLLVALGADVRLAPVDPGTVQALQLPPGDADVATPRAVRAVFVEQAVGDALVVGDVRLLPLPASGALKPGVAVLPSFTGGLNLALPVTADLTMTVHSDLDLRGGIAVEFRPGQAPDVLVGFTSSTVPVRAKGSIEARLEHGGGDGGDEPTVILGAADRSRLSFRALAGAVGLRLDAEQGVDLYAEAELRGLEFVLLRDGADGFVARLIPADGIRFATDLTVGVSTRHGFYFRGTSQLAIQVPAHVRLGPVEVQALTISAAPAGTTLPVGLGATLLASLGPIRAVVEDVGLRATFDFRPGYDGNLGPVDLSLGFQPPKGVGLVVHSGPVRGGGFLRLDPERGEYAGALELVFADFLTLNAIGIITTGASADGFSVLVVVSAEFGSGLQVGFGFTLLAVGGIVALNRGMSITALAEGVRTGSINSVMFPTNVIANAPKIISDLRTFFPPRPGTLVIGPMAKLGWGTPRLLELTLGVIIEIPGNVAIVGVLGVVLPKPEAPVVVLRVRFIGAIEFDRKRVWFHARLFESRVAGLPVDGEVGLLAAWGGDANFVVSVGGFHPRFQPPPLPFPAPRRITISLLNNSVARLTAQAYFAVTSNTVQFGAQVDLYFGLSAFTVTGNIGFDALVRFSPFHFIIDIASRLSVKVFGAGLFTVSVKGTLEGPSPWHIKGHGKISLLFWGINVDFERTWGSRVAGLLAPIAVLPMLVTELQRPEAWRAVNAARLTETLRAAGAQDDAELLVHPSGTLRVSQRAVPLGIQIDKVGHQRPSDVNRVTLTVSSGLTKTADAYEQFAPGQFIDSDDAGMLAQPAFAPQLSGLDLASSDLRTGALVRRVVRYEEVIIDTPFGRENTDHAAYPGGLFEFFALGSAVARTELSYATRTQRQPFASVVGVREETFVVANASDNRAVATDAVFSSAASAHEYVRGLVAGNPNLAGALQVVPSVEAVA